MKNYYDVVGVKPNATFLEIKSAYLKKIKKYHPDVFKGDKSFAEQKTSELTEAYNTLKDEELRLEYDLKNNIHRINKKTDQRTNDKEDENIIKDFGGKIKHFFNNLKTDLHNFRNNIKNNKKINKKTEKNSKNKQKNINENKTTIKNIKKEFNKLPIVILSLILIVIILFILLIYVV